jgi:hypothetical protein
VTDKIPAMRNKTPEIKNGEKRKIDPATIK